MRSVQGRFLFALTVDSSRQQADEHHHYQEEKSEPDEGEHTVLLSSSPLYRRHMRVRSGQVKRGNVAWGGEAVKTGSVAEQRNGEKALVRRKGHPDEGVVRTQRSSRRHF